MEQPTCYDLEEARKKFSYSIEPFRQVVSKRNLNYNQEIGLRWSGTKAVEKLEFFSFICTKVGLKQLKNLKKKKKKSFSNVHVMQVKKNYVK